MAENINIKIDWADTKVHPAIRYPSSWVDDVDDTEATPLIGMIDSFSPRIVTPKDVISSLNDGNQGFVSKHPEYYIDITCKPHGEGYNMLLACQNGDRYFDIILLPIDNYINADAKEVGQPAAAWGPQKEVFAGCKVTNMAERYAMNSVPTTTFSCRALRFSLQDVEFGDGKKGRTYTRSEIPGLGTN